MLLRQLIRGLWRGKRSYLACVLLMAMGIGIYVAFHLVFNGLTEATQSMYRQQRFGEAFATVTQMPSGAVDRITAIQGVDRVEATLVADARMEREDSSRLHTLRLSSFDPEAEEPLNDFHLARGSLPGENEILVGVDFAAANGLAVGDTVSLVIAGTRITSAVSGTVQSPEYVYAIPDSGQLMPDNEAFGFGYMELERMGTLIGKSGFATNLSLTFSEGYGFKSLKPQLEDALKPYGLKTLISRDDQPSHVMLDQELESIGTMASSIPMMLIVIAVIILYILLKRMIEQERTQIGVLKAFGFSDRVIRLHYIGYGAAIGLSGGLLGGVFGVGLFRAMLPIYLEFFSLPSAQVPVDPAYLLGGVALALASGVVGAWMGTHAILRLRPGEAMRPPAPPALKGDLLGRLPFLGALFDTFGFMALRNITRSRFRSAFVALGLAVSFAITAFMASFGDMFDRLMLDQFTKVERYDLKITLSAPAGRTAALEEAWSLEGVGHAEGLLELPVELHSGHRKKSVSLTGIQADSRLYAVYDGDSGETFAPPYGGVILSSSLADSLEARRGDLLQMVTGHTGDERIALPVLGVVESSLGSTAYIRMDGLWELLEIPPTISAVILNTQDPVPIKEALLEADNVAAITDQEEMKRMYEDLLETYAVMIYMLQLAGMGIAFAIITNTAAISLSERAREYATMRVLGMQPGEIGRVIGLEYWMLLLLAIPPGILLTRVFKEAMAGMIDNELFSIPVHTEPSSFVAAGVLCALAVVLSNLGARRKIAKFDMPQVLKERE